MAGGTWTTQNKVRPGAYVNTTSNGGVGTSESTSGVTTIPIALDFGPEKQVVSITAASDLTKLGYDLGSEKLLALKEALKRATTVLLYRVGSGAKATITEGPVTISALYGGSRGNDISVVAAANVNTTGYFDVTTYMAGSAVDTQTVARFEELAANDIVSFSGEGDVTAFTATLAGGSDTAATANDYMTYFDAVQVYEFNTMALPVEDEAIKVAGASFIKRMRDDEGKKCQLVVAKYNADHEAVINVKNGVILTDGTVISAEMATAWVAGATAAAGVATSLTYSVYDGAVDVTERYLNSDIIAALQTGEFLFIEKRGEVVVEQDINSLHTFSTDKGKDFAKNRVLRVLDDIANNAKKTFEDNYIGKVNNDVDGRELFKADRVAYFDNLLAQGAITEFAADDIAIAAGNDKDSVYMEVAVQPIDAMEKLYMLVNVQ